MSVPPPVTAARSRDQRRARRTKVFLVAEVGADAVTRSRAHILDISCQGARIHARTSADLSGQVDLVVAGGRQAGSIMWAEHPTFGIRFAAPLSAERLDQIVAID